MGEVMTSKSLMRGVQAVAESAAARKVDGTRHKCFVSYHVADIDEVKKFLNDYGSEFIARTVGVTEEDDFVDSTDTEYIKRRIRETYLSDSTVTIVLLGKCTHKRKFVDWELSSSLRRDTVNTLSGLLAMPLPSMNNSATLPARVGDNFVRDNEPESYALFRSYPATAAGLRTNIHAAFNARTNKSGKVKNSRDLRSVNGAC